MLREFLAKEIFEIWKRVIKTIFFLGTYTEDRQFIITEESMNKLIEMFHSTYLFLPDQEKNSLLDEADNILEIMQKYFIEEETREQD